MRLKAAIIIAATLIPTVALAALGWMKAQDRGPSALIASSGECKGCGGAGGYIVGLTIVCDSTCGNGSGTSTKLAHTDTYGGYYLNPNATPCGNVPIPGCWQQMVTSTSINSSTIEQTYAQSQKPIVDIRAAPSNTQHFYMLYGVNNPFSSSFPGYFFSSTNRGTNWTASPTFTGFTFFTGDTQSATIAVDPANENVVFVGMTVTTPVYSSDSGTTFGNLSTIPKGNGSTTDLFAFDPTSGTSGGKTTTLYECRQGTGVYVTTNAQAGTSAVWVTQASPQTIGPAPTSCINLYVDAAGDVWVVDINGLRGGNGNLYELTGPKGNGTWANITSNQGFNVSGITADPYNTAVIYGIAGNGTPYVSYNTGTSFTHLSNGGNDAVRVATDIPYLANTNEQFMTAGGIVVDPAQTQWTTSSTSNAIASSGTVTFTTAGNTLGSVPAGTRITAYETSNSANIMQGTLTTSSLGSTVGILLASSSGSGTHTDWTVGTNVLYFSEGIGVWYATPPITGPITWHSQSAGIEQLVTTGIAAPWGASACTALGTSTSVPVTINEDRTLFAVINKNIYPTNHGPNYNIAINASWGIDWSGQNPQNLVSVTAASYNVTTTSGISISQDCGNSWVGTPTSPADVSGNAFGSATEAVPVMGAVTTKSMAFMQLIDGDYYTTDGGVTWHTMVWGGGAIPTAGYVYAGAGSTGTVINVLSSLDNGTGGGTPTWLLNDAGSTLNVWDVTADSSGSHITTTVLTPVTASAVTLTTSLGITPNAGDLILFRCNNQCGVTQGVPTGKLVSSIVAVAAQPSIVSDKVTDKTFYMALCCNSSGSFGNGFWKSSDGGATWAKQCSTASSGCNGAFSTGSNFPGLRSVPGKAGNVFSYGNPTLGGAIPNANNQGIWFTTNGGTSWSELTTSGHSMESVTCLGFGAPMPGSDGYPTVYFFGWVNQGSGYVGGVWRIVNADSTPIFTNWTSNTQYPQGSLDPPQACEGDGNIAGLMYIGFQGSGWQYFQTN